MCEYIVGCVSICCGCIVHAGTLSHEFGECSNCGEVNGHQNEEQEEQSLMDEYRDKGMSPSDFFSE